MPILVPEFAMLRLATSIFALAAAIGPAIAADWGKSPGDIYREAYSIEPYEWSEMGDQNDGIHIETGLRYWYSMGSQSYERGSDAFEASDTAHTVEVHLRIEEDATSTYAKAWAGYSAAINGDYEDPYSSGEVIDGQLGYAGADFGWNALSDGKSNGAGVFLGYNYWNNSPRTSRENYATATSVEDLGANLETGTWSMPGNSEDDRIELHMLRLGLSGKAEVNELFDISGEVAAVPFATINGQFGGDVGSGYGPGPFPGCDIGDPCSAYTFKGSTTAIEGWGYGGMAELMAGFHPTENITLRLGGRAWYVQGTYDATYREVTVIPPVELPYEGDPPAPQNPRYDEPVLTQAELIETENPFAVFRYGLLAELTYRF
jgi:hypothetical protein